MYIRFIKLYLALAIICAALTLCYAFADTNNIEFEIDVSGTITSYTGSDTELVIPQNINDVTVNAIGDYAFENISSLVSVTIPDGVTSIGMRAFSGCSGLEEVVIPESVNRIENHSFAVCPVFTKVTIPRSVNYIGENVFDGCSALTLGVYPDSYAHEWCRENDVRYKCAGPHRSH